MNIKTFLQGLGSWLVILLPVFTISIKETAALEVFKWKDRQGITQYSSEPPSELAGGTAEILFIAPSVRSGADQPDERVNYAKWLEMAKVLEQSRLARDRLRLEKARLLVEAAGQQSAAQDTTSVVEFRRLSHPVFYHNFLRHYPKLHHQGHGYYRSSETHAPAPKYIRAYKGYRARSGS
ncbi:MAG: DUF4124 domain-containing protein [Gammaproteobacteria bacterium]|nr:DUF4124 domain-containing protein [Gammaproteobacteria bacterium]